MNKTFLFTLALLVVAHTKNNIFTRPTTTTVGAAVSLKTEGIPYVWTPMSASTFQSQNPGAVLIAQTAVQLSYNPQLVGYSYSGLTKAYSQQITGTNTDNYALVLQYSTMITYDIYYEVIMNSALDQVISVIPLGISSII